MLLQFFLRKSPRLHTIVAEGLPSCFNRIVDAAKKAIRRNNTVRSIRVPMDGVSETPLLTDTKLALSGWLSPTWAAFGPISILIAGCFAARVFDFAAIHGSLRPPHPSSICWRAKLVWKVGVAGAALQQHMNKCQISDVQICRLVVFETTTVAPRGERLADSRGVVTGGAACGFDPLPRFVNT